MISSGKNSALLPFPRTGKRGVPQQFPRRLFEMLNKETKAIEGRPKYPKVISWSLSGKAFRIHNVADFASTILPKYFRTTKFSSFQRNLNLYGFTKVRRGADTDMYAHPSFIRDHPDLLVELRKITGTTCPSSLRRNCIVSALMMPSSNPLTMASYDKTNFNQASRSVSPVSSQFGESNESSVVSSPISDKSAALVPYQLPVANCNTVFGDQVGHEYIRRRILKEQRMQDHRCLQQRSEVVVHYGNTSKSVSCISNDTGRDSLEATNKQARSATSDRGKLDLLAMALEYECFGSLQIRVENHVL